MRDREREDGRRQTSTRRWSLSSTCQILVGALMRHLGAGLAIPDFPLAFGRRSAVHFIGIAVNFAHRVGAVLVASRSIVMIAIAALRGSARSARMSLTCSSAVVALQICLGAQTVWSGKRLRRSRASHVA